MEDESPKRKPQGFGTMTPEQRQKAASLGGQAAHKQGRAHKFSPEQARLAGAKGLASRKRAGPVVQSAELTTEDD